MLMNIINKFKELRLLLIFFFTIMGLYEHDDEDQEEEW